MPDIAEMDSYDMLRQDWGSAYRITRTPGAAHPYQAERRDDPAVVLTAATPAALRDLIRVPVWAPGTCPTPRSTGPASPPALTSVRCGPWRSS